MMKIHYSVDKEEILEFLAEGNLEADFWGYLWFDFDGVIVAETPTTYHWPRGYEPEDVNGWRVLLRSIKNLKIGENYKVIFCGANRLSLDFEVLDENIMQIKHYHDNDLLWRKEYGRSDIVEEIDLFEKNISNEIDQYRSL